MRAKAREGRALTVDEIHKLLEALPYYRHPLIQIMTLTGLRIGEALAMQWKYYHKIKTAPAATRSNVS